MGLTETHAQNPVRILVVGGGPVGLAAAIQARLHGMEAWVFDRQSDCIDKACGEGLMPGGVQALKELGVRMPPSQPFTGIRYHQEDVSDSSPAEGSFGTDSGLGIRRTLLHKALVERAEALGAQLHWDCAVTGFKQNSIQTSSGDFEGDWIIAADGLHSPMRKWAGLNSNVSSPKRYGLRRHYEIAPWSDRVEVYWSLGCEAYVTPVGPQCVGVAILWNQEKHRPSKTRPLAPFPQLEKTLRDAEYASVSQGSGPLRRDVHAVQKGRLLLVGDAAGYVDALTGEGLSLGFQQAKAAVHAIAEGKPEHYSRAHHTLSKRPFFLTRKLCWLASRPTLRRRFIRALAKDPVLFSRGLELMEGRRGWLGLGVFRCLRLLLRLAFP